MEVHHHPHVEKKNFKEYFFGTMSEDQNIEQRPEDRKTERRSD